MTRPIPWLLENGTRVLAQPGYDFREREGGAKSEKEANIPVDIKHTKRLDPILPQNPLLTRIHVAQTNIYQLAQTQPVFLLQPTKVLVAVLGRKTRQEGHGHPVNISTAARLGSIDVGVRIDPDHGDFPTQALAQRFRTAADGADGDAVVAAQGEDQAALGGVLVDLLGDAVRDGRDGLGVLHAAVGRVGALRGDQVRVQVDRVVAVEFVAQLVAQLRQQARLNERRGRGVDAWFALAAAEADGDDAEVLGVGEEFGLNHGGVEALVVVVGLGVGTALEGDGGLAFLGGRGGAVGGSGVAVGGGGAVLEGGRSHFVGVFVVGCYRKNRWVGCRW